MRHLALIHPSAWKGYSENFVKAKFSEVRLSGVLGSLFSASNAQVSAKIVHLSDTPAPTEEYGRPAGASVCAAIKANLS
jgi:hypothetical protein